MKTFYFDESGKSDELKAQEALREQEKKAKEEKRLAKATFNKKVKAVLGKFKNPGDIIRALVRFLVTNQPNETAERLAKTVLGRTGKLKRRTKKK